MLTYIEEKLEAEEILNDEGKKLLDYVHKFKENLTTLSKSQIKQKSITLLTKMKKFGVKLFFDTLEVGYKEVIKFALKGGVEEITKLILKV